MLVKGLQGYTPESMATAADVSAEELAKDQALLDRIINRQS